MTTSSTEQPEAIPALTTKPVTDASSWRAARQDGFTMELPSGNVARIRRGLDLTVLLKTGQIPNPLAQVVNEMIRTQNPDFPTDKMTNEAITQMMDLVDKTCEKCFVEPRVEIRPPLPANPTDEQTAAFNTWQPSEGAISIEDVDQRDRFFVFAWAQGAPADLAPFRAQTHPAVATAQNVAAVQDDAVEPSGDR